MFLGVEDVYYLLDILALLTFHSKYFYISIYYIFYFKNYSKLY